MMTEIEIAEAYANFEHVIGSGRKPMEDHEPTDMQISAIKHVVDTGRNPYVHFGIFGPHGLRILRKVRLTGQGMDRDGSYRTIELMGPPTFETWLASWNVFKTILIMLQVAPLGALLEYQGMMEAYYDMHGLQAWALLYQFDVRTRLEHFERLRREAHIEYLKQQAQRAQGRHY